LETQRLKGNIVFLLLIAVLIGVVTGCLAVGFRYLLYGATEFFWGDSSEIIDSALAMPWYLVLFIPALGGLVVGPIIAFLAPETRGAGVPEVIETIIVHEGVIRHRTTFFKTLTTVISIGTGASVGREGPIVHIGASVGSSLAQIIKLPTEWRRVFLACGAAAGIAATFNAPMAGMLFAAEIILVDFQVGYLSHIAISSITAMELFYGARNKAEVKKLEKFILLFTLLYPDETLSRKAMELVKQYAKSHSLDIPDSLIAATALTQNCELFTYNRKDFRYIDGLKLVEP